MSLDVYLMVADAPEIDFSEDRIFIRREGATVPISREEWDELHPDREPVTVTSTVTTGQVFTANITHNLVPMAKEAGLYEPLWRPDTIGIMKAAELIEPLKAGLARLVDDHQRLEEFNPASGWGDYGLLLRFTTDYLAACEIWPEADVMAFA